MKIISFIKDENVIKQILTHLKLWEDPFHNIHSPPLSEQRVDQITYPKGTVSLYEPFFDDLPYDEQLELAMNK